jgi:hypothetical protein
MAFGTIFFFWPKRGRTHSPAKTRPILPKAELKVNEEFRLRPGPLNDPPVQCFEVSQTGG